MKTLFLLFLLTGCSHLFYQPTRHLYLDPHKLKITYEDHFFKSKDKTKLHSWFFPAVQKEPKGTVILFHGNAQNLSSHYLNLVWIVREGYNLFVFDYRGYGKSEGSPNQKGVYEDGLAALDFGWELNQKHGKGKFIVYGQSLGGAVALRSVADFSKLDQVDLIVQDSTFSSYKDIAFDKLTSRWFLYPLSPIALIAVSDAYASDEVFDKIKRPVLVIAGENDQIVPPKFGKVIYKGVASKTKWQWNLKTGHHIEVFHNQQEVYRPQFLSLLESLGRE